MEVLAKMNSSIAKNEITEIMIQRRARFYQLFAGSPVALDLPLIIPTTNHRLDGVEHPFVITTLVAGLAGVTLSIIIVLSLWILKRAANRRTTSKKGQYVQNFNDASYPTSNATSIANPNYSGTAHPKETPV